VAQSKVLHPCIRRLNSFSDASKSKMRDADDVTGDWAQGRNSGATTPESAISQILSLSMPSKLM
jgi:hypothetical protein